MKAVEMHYFSDVLVDGYGQCSHLRLINEHGQAHCSFIVGKAHVTPLKPLVLAFLLQTDSTYST